MGFKRQALSLVLLSLLTFSWAKKSPQEVTGGKIAIYWGQNKDEGTLTATCDTGNYDIVLLSFLNKFGCRRTPSGNFDCHCGNDWSTCEELAPEIKHCQEKGVKVFLSLGGPSGDYSLCSSSDAVVVANYLYGNFLSGESGPLGKVTLDGIDFDIQKGSNLYWDCLAKELQSFKDQNQNFYLSAAPRCFIPDYHLNQAIKKGYFDYIFVKFYNSPSCQYTSGGITTFLLSSWNAWTSFVPSNSLVFLGLPAAPAVAPLGGYVAPQVVTSDILPYIMNSSNYGGIVIWDRSLDNQTQFTQKIKDQAKKMVVLPSGKAIY
ncbi:unnamed protein product [Sphenostylis stenocarpa]|uniref:Acidic endochitinase n=1 Tax=Sphenostylis stenocarpa TaxID=92480 RepID=A0AA86W226_9FABA|nr:unnamed protein product [Sphenostylis stenocarpa]CAJ1976977.1 unnamed protein product [Sphenostylis stenocarpa]